MLAKCFVFVKVTRTTYRSQKKVFTALKKNMTILAEVCIHNAI